MKKKTFTIQLKIAFHTVDLFSDDYNFSSALNNRMSH